MGATGPGPYGRSLHKSGDLWEVHVSDFCLIRELGVPVKIEYDAAIQRVHLVHMAYAALTPNWALRLEAPQAVMVWMAKTFALPELEAMFRLVTLDEYTARMVEMWKDAHKDDDDGLHAR